MGPKPREIKSVECLPCDIGKQRRDATERDYQISGIELETVIPGRLISIHIALTQIRIVV
jgi:hypothetical protein